MICKRSHREESVLGIGCKVQTEYETLLICRLKNNVSLLLLNYMWIWLHSEGGENLSNVFIYWR